MPRYPRRRTAAQIPLPTNLQLQSPLLRLPTEIQQIIFTYALTAPGPVINPALQQELETPVRSLGTALPRTCRKIYHTIPFFPPAAPLYLFTEFHFTHLSDLGDFLYMLPRRRRALIRDVTLSDDVLHRCYPAVEDWKRDHFGQRYQDYWGGITVLKGRTKLSGLQVLTLQFRGWEEPADDSWDGAGWMRYSIAMGIRTAVRRLADLGLQRLLLVAGRASAGVKPWSSVNFVGGLEDIYRYRGFLAFAGDAVGGKDGEPRGDKVIRWTRVGNFLNLEVVMERYLVRNVDRHWTGPSLSAIPAELGWPDRGSLAWSTTYELARYKRITQ
ncbi:uncharacterized protein EI97DRAFT_100143 [Westerdykella ornata]|uniref:Uncharacterized protein n=1 Tax=Westerdykella ornata TaxID=318751 RepID=A0A6A6JE25_WESOR|nr:uncharacterized protein EI97DRAFT_100143 [Westerdykella ornata]KAF2274464.1 hypothetical protein EI97DRAFT_100143 [Westerdykella ornata]